MQEYPHHYKAEALGGPDGEVQTESLGLEAIPTTSPPQFGGPEGYWSPETMLTASVANCLVLTFRAVARASRFDWLDLRCNVEGKLEIFNTITRFTFFRLKAHLRVPEGTMKAKAELLLRKAENNCLITNSLSADIHLDTEIEEVPKQRVA